MEKLEREREREICVIWGNTQTGKTKRGIKRKMPTAYILPH